MTFEVFGIVQGVFFRKYTKEMADSLKLHGFVENTNRKTVVGEAQGPLQDIHQFKEFLKSKGSPQSKIDKLESQITPITEYTFPFFSIKRRAK